MTKSLYLVPVGKHHVSLRLTDKPPRKIVTAAKRTAMTREWTARSYTEIPKTFVIRITDWRGGRQLGVYRRYQVMEALFAYSCSPTAYEVRDGKLAEVPTTVFRYFRDPKWRTKNLTTGE